MGGIYEEILAASRHPRRCALHRVADSFDATDREKLLEAIGDRNVLPEAISQTLDRRSLSLSPATIRRYRNEGTCKCRD